MKSVVSVRLGEKRSGPGSEGWPHCITVEYSTGGLTEIVLAEQREYSSVREAIDLINKAISK